MFKCNWPGCSHGAEILVDLCNHIREHLEPHWKQRRTCAWKGCKSKILFTDISSLIQHAEKRHLNTFICEHPGCSYKKAFRDWTDLTRHNKIKHGSILPFECPFAGCATIICPRKDKLLQHIKNTQHDGDAICIYGHCKAKQLTLNQPFTTRKDISIHYSLFHVNDSVSNGIDTIICRIGSCATNFEDHHFNFSGLGQHLREDHVVGIGAWTWKSFKESTVSSIRKCGLTQELFYQFFPSDKTGIPDCKVCIISKANDSIITEHLHYGQL